MDTTSQQPPLWSTIANDYGMVFVLLLLIAVLSALTLEQQNPTGAEAGKLVAGEIVDQHGDSATVGTSAPEAAGRRQHQRQAMKRSLL